MNDNGLRKPNIERPQTAKLRVVFEMDEIIPIQESQLEPEIESIVLPDYEAMASRIQVSHMQFTAQLCDHKLKSVFKIPLL